MIIDSDIIGSEDKDVITEWADSEIENSMELIDFSWFFLEGGSSELGDLLLADQALG
jgi:hypothetical protein